MSLAVPTVPKSMMAMPLEGYGDPGWKPVSTPVPELDPTRVMVEVRAASINPADVHAMKGGPVTGILNRVFNGFKKPVPPPAAGSDVAGVVVALGSEPSGFQIGDEVFGSARGSLAEYGAAKNLTLKPACLSWEQAASMGIAGVTALQGLRDKGRLQAGQSVLINGASGGVGTFAIQIAKAMGARVTGVCSSRNVELVRSLGADNVVDYTKEDFSLTGEKYDVVFDVVGNRSVRALARCGKRDGVVVLAGGGHQNGHGKSSMIWPLLKIGRAVIFGRFSRPRLTTFIANITPDDLAVLAGMAEEGKLKPAVEGRYTLDQSAEAFEYLVTGRAPAKIVVTVKPSA